MFVNSKVTAVLRTPYSLRYQLSIFLGSTTNRVMCKLSLIALAFGMADTVQGATIYPIGDSITRGAAYSFDASAYPNSAYRANSSSLPSSIRSYREHLHDMLVSTSCEADIEWVGAKDELNRVPKFHEGRSGWRADEIASRNWADDNGNNSGNTIGDWLAEFVPDYVTIHLGTNDMQQGESAESTRDDLNNLLDIVYLQRPNAKVYLANVIPMFGWWANHVNVAPYPEADTGDEVRQLSSLINELVATRAGEGDDIYLVDVHSTFYVNESDVTNCATGELGDPANMSMSLCKTLPDGSEVGPDGLHPNIVGDKFIADQFYSVITATSDICSVGGSGVDSLAPVAFISSPGSAGERLPSVAQLSGSATENGGSGFDTVMVSVENSSGEWLDFSTGSFESDFRSAETVLSNTNTTSTDWSISTPGLPDGLFSLTIEVQDLAGNTSQLVSSFEIRDDIEAGQDDSAAPIVVITMPLNPGTAFSSVAQLAGFSYDSGGSGFNRVEIAIQNSDGGWLDFSTGEFQPLFMTVDAALSDTTLERTEWSFTTPALPDGAYELSVSTWDNAGNSDSSTNSFVVDEALVAIASDTENPTVEISSPRSAEEIFLQTVPLSGSIIDAGGSGLNRVDVVIQNSSGEWLNFLTGEFSTSYTAADAFLSTTSAEQTEWSVNTPELPRGFYALTVTAVDNAGNASLATSTVRVLSSEGDAETTPLLPIVRIGSPNTAGEKLSSQAELSGVAIDAAKLGFDVIEVALQNVSGEWLDFSSGVFGSDFSATIASLDNTTNESTDWTVTTPELQVGTYALTVTARNYAGTASLATGSFVVSDLTDGSASVNSGSGGGPVSLLVLQILALIRIIRCWHRFGIRH